MKAMEKQVVNKIEKLQNIREIENLRIELYSIFTILILSNKQFPKNIEIKSFLESFSIKFKDYVYISRTTILSRTLRVINEANEDYLAKIVLILIEKNKDINKRDNKSMSKRNKKDDEYVLNILERYTRNEPK